ncbi:MAG: hypothetical protein U1C97_03705, partial [Candidatus Gracilibacteria bacterium]|nr:hypothetical protein [Candidatus Gracilibacteria bacterium]
DYRCESFVNFQEKILIPFEIQPIVQTGNRYRTKGKLVVLGINQGQPIKFDIQYFELWKELDWPLWHINNPKSGPRKINSEPFVF